MVAFSTQMSAAITGDANSATATAAASRSTDRNLAIQLSWRFMIFKSIDVTLRRHPVLTIATAIKKFSSLIACLREAELPDPVPAAKSTAATVLRYELPKPERSLRRDNTRLLQID